MTNFRMTNFRMTNFRMTNDELMTNDESRTSRRSLLHHSVFVIPSTFDIRHSAFL